MLTYQIRGGLGTQLLNLMAAYADAYEQGKDISKVILNFHNYPEGLREINIDFISKTIDHDLAIENISGRDKFDIFKKDRVLKVSKHIEKIRKAMPVKKNDIPNVSETILHVRQLDRPLVNLDTYSDVLYDFENLQPWFVIGDDVKVLDSLLKCYVDASHSPYDNDSVKEWFMLCKAKLAIGGFSSYVLSAALLNPSLEYKMITRDICDQNLINEEVWKCLDLFVELFDNINWMSYD